MKNTFSKLFLSVTCFTTKFVQSDEVVETNSKNIAEMTINPDLAESVELVRLLDESMDKTEQDCFNILSIIQNKICESEANENDIFCSVKNCITSNKLLLNSTTICRDCPCETCVYGRCAACFNDKSENTNLDKDQYFIKLRSDYSGCYTCPNTCKVCNEPLLKNETIGICEQDKWQLYISPWSIICPGMFIVFLSFYAVFVIVTEFTLTSIRREREVYTKPQFNFSKFSKSTASKPSTDSECEVKSEVFFLKRTCFFENQCKTRENQWKPEFFENVSESVSMITFMHDDSVSRALEVATCKRVSKINVWNSHFFDE